DLEAAAASVPGSVFDNAGQDCCARSRLLVQRSVLDRFLELLEPAVASWRVGDPADESTQMGPLVSARHLERVRSFVDDATPALFRGSAPEGPGFWFAPAVVMPASRTDRLATDEIFGPVVSVLPFDDEADAIALANASVYG
ncbi:aldehyde dehydrogenase family protein, partial [Mesorhizobium japonicum]|uniref:aldehyde dehydrogenase family protein n=1 Tax=Mesorhizobium japonicum TaxID=2066070 RepID=UPI003B5A0BBF